MISDDGFLLTFLRKSCIYRNRLNKFRRQFLIFNYQFLIHTLRVFSVNLCVSLCNKKKQDTGYLSRNFMLWLNMML
jgi:hypothetical protein